MHTFCVPTYAGKVPTSVKRNFLQARQNIIKLVKGQVIIGSFHCALIESHSWDCIPLFYMQTSLKVTFHVNSTCAECMVQCFASVIFISTIKKIIIHVKTDYTT